MPLHIDDTKKTYHPDCTTPLEDMKLLMAKSYFDLVSGNDEDVAAQSAGPFPAASLTGLGDTNLYTAWPPGPQPTPYKWTDKKTGVTWTQVLLDGKYMYRSSKDGRMFITASNLYDLMGVVKNPDTGFAPVLPPAHPDEPVSKWSLAGLGAGWLVVGGIAAWALLKKKKGRH